MIENTRNFLSSLSVNAQIDELKKELDILIGFRTRFRGTRAEWDLGVTFVRDSFLEEHAKEITDAQLDLNSWPVRYIDWEKAANGLRNKYESIIFKGVQYWFIK